MKNTTPAGIEWFRNARFGLFLHYGPVTNLWFDGWGTPKAGPWKTELCLPELYRHIRTLQPDCLISYKLGITGTEDFFAPEYHWPARFPAEMKEAVASDKPIELCHHIAGWGYQKANTGKHRGADSVMEDLEYASRFDANLLLNTGPLPDGSIDARDMATLRETGRRLRGGV